VAAGLVHIMTSRPQEGTGSVRKTHPDVLSPSVFYEGVATGKYKIERKLGEGAMGVVYEATDQSLGRKVAIKKMGDEIKVNEREKQRFLEEARTVAQLHHPGIVEIYTIFEEEDNIYLVFEHVDGVTLDKVLDKEARIHFERAQKMFGEAAAALAYAHGKNIVHRDLKLANMMLSREGAVKVMDFGLAHRARESMARMSNAEVVGSPAYMAPEQELGVSSAESDIYSLGVCLYEALSGVLPFQGPDFHHQKTHRSYQPLSQILPGLPKGADELVARCLDPDPEKRFRSADELARALGALV
jgi:serine/threonine protein kinase